MPNKHVKKRPAQPTQRKRAAGAGRTEGAHPRKRRSAAPDYARGPKRRKSPGPRRAPSRRPRVSETSDIPGDRLQKVLAAAGLGSRRQCEELITTGRVEIDRQVVRELGTRVDISTQEVRVDGEPLSQGRRVYWAVNKPKGVVSTNSDPSGRPRVIDMVPVRGPRLFAVGRLDLSSEGLILLTNDGELANRLTHPRYGIRKTYLVQVAGQPSHEVLDELRRGMHLAEGVARAEEVSIKSRHKESTWLEMVLSEGRNREIRRLMAQAGHKVMRLTRVAVGPIRLGKMPPGASRKLTGEEVRMLQEAVKETADHG